jgi:hypothetical protein
VPRTLADRISSRVDPSLNSIYHPAPTLDASPSPLHSGPQKALFGECEEDRPTTPQPDPARAYKTHCILEWIPDSDPPIWDCRRHEPAWCPNYQYPGDVPNGSPGPLIHRIGQLPLLHRVDPPSATPVQPSSQFIAQLFPSTYAARHHLPHKPSLAPTRPLPVTPGGVTRTSGTRQKPAPYAPIQRLVDFNFRKKASTEVTAIFGKRINATIKRVNVIFVGDDFGRLLPDTRDSINRLADQLDWLNEHVDKIANLKELQQHAIEWGLKHIGAISFIGLRANYVRIAQQLADIHGLGFFDHVDPKAPTFASQFCT